jgi:hypothetical protein
MWGAVYIEAVPRDTKRNDFALAPAPNFRCQTSRSPAYAPTLMRYYCDVTKIEQTSQDLYAKDFIAESGHLGVQDADLIMVC